MIGFFIQINLCLDQNAKPILQVFKQIEQEIKGRGLLVYVNCEYEYRLNKKKGEFYNFCVFLEKEKNFVKSLKSTQLMQNYDIFCSLFSKI